jgi:hypothetical protein
MIRVWTLAGHLTFADADSYSISPIPPSNPMAPTSAVLQYNFLETLPGSLKIWRVSPDPDVDEHEMLAWFAPGGWIGLDFTDIEPEPEQIPEPKLGFQPPTLEEGKPRGPVGTPSPPVVGTPSRPSVGSPVEA